MQVQKKKKETRTQHGNLGDLKKKPKSKDLVRMEHTHKKKETTYKELCLEALKQRDFYNLQ